MKIYNFAVIGRDVSKSSSPVMHEFIAGKFGYKINYEKISVREDGFDSEVGGLFDKLDGFNVTVPYKIRIIKHLNKIVGDAEIFGSVNTVKCGEKIGYNTDGAGFSLMLKNGGVDVKGGKVLLLGAGGAGRSVAKKLADAGALVEVYDVHKEKSFALANEFAGVAALGEVKPGGYYLIINATGTGMHETEGISPVGEDILKNCSVAADLIYNPEKSEFLKIAESLGKKTINGSAMLFYQAYFAECIYSGREADPREAKTMFAEFKER